MTTSTIHHRPAPFIAAAAVVAAIAAGSVALSVSHDDGTPSTPQHRPENTVPQLKPGLSDFQPTTSGGRVMLGQ